MKYLKRNNIVNAFKLTRENLPNIVKELLGNEYVEDILIDNLCNYLTLKGIEEGGDRYTRTKYLKDNTFIVLEKNEPPKFMEDKDFYSKYEKINE